MRPEHSIEPLIAALADAEVLRSRLAGLFGSRRASLLM